MFAPHCPSCRTRVLLGTDRIVELAADGMGGLTVTLRCTCGELVDWGLGAVRPRRPTRRRLSPAPAAHRSVARNGRLPPRTRRGTGTRQHRTKSGRQAGL